MAFGKRLIFGMVMGATAMIGPVRGDTLIRDAEIERTLGLMSRTIFQKAGISPNAMNIYIVNSNRMNAFVTPGNNLFIHQGLIKRLSTPEMLQAVIAHEAGHIAGGHLSQRYVDAANAKTAAGLGLLLAAAVAAAGGPGDLAAGVALGSSSAATRGFLANTRTQESSADRSGARYLAEAGIDPAASIEVLKLFEGQNLMTAKRQDPYVQTHPLSQQRISDLQGYVAAYRPKAAKQPANLDYWYKRMVAKFNGFTENPSFILRKTKASDTSEYATLTRAIAYHQKPNPKRAMAEINKLLQMRPNDAFYWELRGQFLLENRQIDPAVQAYRNAVKLAPNEPLLIAGLGRALNAVNSPNSNKEALRVLQRAYAKDPRDGRMLRELAVAFARAKQNGSASLVTAERYALSGNLKQAKVHADRAMGLLPQGSSGWLKAQDISILAERVAKRK